MTFLSFQIACCRLVSVLLVTVAAAQAQSVSHPVDAVRLNNDGVALMNQQQTQRAQAKFVAAAEADPTLEQAALNQGIALLILQQLTEAQRELEIAARLNPQDPRPWYNLGLVERSANEIERARESFAHAVQLDPSDADSLYFEGVCLQDMKQYEQAIELFGKALASNPLHASSEFAMARALQRTGRLADARPHFQRFQHLTSAKVSSALGLSYGEQGRYSIALAVMERARASSAPIAVTFQARALSAATHTSAAGNTSGDERQAGRLPGTPDVRTAARSTGGACALDVDGDGLSDLVLMRSASSAASAIEVLRNKGQGDFAPLAPEALGLIVVGHAVSCAVGDYDSDGHNDLAVATEDHLLLFRNLGNGRFRDVTGEAGLSMLNRPRGMTFVDYDHDGDLDLLVSGSALRAGGQANVLWRNNGNKTFTDVTAEAGLEGTDPTSGAILSDVNNDRAVDLIVAGEGRSPMVYLNPREGKFAAMPLFGQAQLSATRGVAVLDFDKDGWMDVAVTHAGAPGLSLWRNRGGKSFERVALPLAGVRAAWGVTAIDYDNDGWIDLAVLVETADGAGVRVLRNQGDGSFVDMSHALGLEGVRLDQPRGLMAWDVDGDGAADLVVTSARGEPTLLHNLGGAHHRSLRLQLQGFADNKTAIGTKVEIFSEDDWQKWEMPGASGYMTQGPQEIVAGLGTHDAVEMVRMLWPTGVPQDEINVPNKPLVAYTEADRRGSSCPVLFAWNGLHYTLVTDTIGAAVVGHWFTPARRNISRPEEWIKVDGSQLRAANGLLSLRFAEPMEEVNYIDQLRLLAVDHPAGTAVYPDERFLDDPPFASGKVIVSAAAHPVVGAWNEEGADVQPLLSEVDHRFVSDFTKLPYDGFANMHRLTLDLGEWSASRPLRLFLTGYVEYFSASSLYGAWQAGMAPISPYLEAQLPDGSWQRIDKEMGFPAGLERTIVADLSGKLPPGVRRIRIVTNLQIYWDQILLDNGPEAAPMARTSEVPLAKAELRFHGYPRQLEGASSGDLQYDYDSVSLTGPFQHQRGSYTRYGDVTPLVTGIDNRFAIFGSGEEIGAEFDAHALPALPIGWQRDYFFYANGYVKDMDFYDGSPFTVSQLPFHGMSTYPYPPDESFPEDDDALRYQLEWNDRFDRGEPTHSFRFDYQPRPSTPAETAPTARAVAGVVPADAVRVATASGENAQ